MFNTHARDIVEQHLSSTQFAYTTGGSCTDALLSMQHTIYRYLDEQDCKAVRVFAMDFSKAFDCVNHELLSSKLRQLPLNPLIVNWYLSFLEKRQQRVVYNGFEGQWREVNRGTTQGPADLCLTGLQISTNQRATRKQFWGSIHPRAFRQTNYTCV